MALERLAQIERYQWLSTDADKKPEGVAIGSRGEELDTGIIWLYTAAGWVDRDLTIAALKTALLGSGSKDLTDVVTALGGTGQLDLKLSALRDALRGTGNKTLADVVTALGQTLTTQLSGSNLPLVAGTAEVGSVNKTNRDVVAESVDNIITTIGAENIQTFLPMWETEGTTLYDLLNRNLTFTVDGATLAQDSPFGNCLSFDGVNDYVIQDPISGSSNTETSTASQKLLAPTAVAVQKLKTFTATPKFIRLNLVQIGSLNGGVKLEIRESKDGAAISNGTSRTHECGFILSVVTYNYGFVFETPPNLQADTTYYLALVYDGNTNADASNYILWRYKAATSAYGQGRHYYDGTSWTDTATEDYVFDIYNSDLALGDDFTSIVLSRMTATGLAIRRIFGSSLMRSDEITTSHTISYNSTGVIQAEGYDGSLRTATYYRYPYNSFDVWAMSFAKTPDTDKLCLYHNGQKVATANGTASTAHTALAQPLTIGGAMTPYGIMAYLFQGDIGAFIMTKTAMTEANIAKVSSELLALRKIQEAI